MQDCSRASRSKSFAARRKWKFRGEFFNATNTPPFGLPDADVQDATAGRVLSAGSPREAQLSIKLAF